MQLQDKVALITGGRRIGLVVAGQLAARGVDVMLGYARSRDEAEQAARSVRASGRRAEIVQADLSQPAGCQAVVDATAEKLGRIDILLNMASVYARRPFDELTAAHWDGPLNVDLRGSFLCSLAAAPPCTAAGRRSHHQLQRLDRPKRTSAL
jgi:NAD(P)-dependent dehydrogenase (short-subunit alcohol dehydrogenase family)